LSYSFSSEVAARCVATGEKSNRLLPKRDLRVSMSQLALRQVDYPSLSNSIPIAYSVSNQTLIRSARHNRIRRLWQDINHEMRNQNSNREKLNV
jgi:hypothetical protein